MLARSWDHFGREWFFQDFQVQVQVRRSIGCKRTVLHWFHLHGSSFTWKTWVWQYVVCVKCIKYDISKVVACQDTAAGLQTLLMDGLKAWRSLVWLYLALILLLETTLRLPEPGRDRHAVFHALLFWGCSWRLLNAAGSCFSVLRGDEDFREGWALLQVLMLMLPCSWVRKSLQLLSHWKRRYKANAANADAVPIFPLWLLYCDYLLLCWWCWSVSAHLQASQISQLHQLLEA